MNKWLRATLIICYLVFLFFMYTVTIDKYEMMYEIDPSIPTGAFNNDGAGRVVGGFLLGMIICVQTLSLILEKTNKWKLLSVILALIAVFLYVFR